MKSKGTLLRAGALSAMVLCLSVACLPAMVAFSTERPADSSLVEMTDPAVFDKTEVVYATLTPEGAVEGVYVVNQFEVDQAGKVVDYGPYATVANLTDQSALEFENGEAAFSVNEGAFYYQGNVAADDAKLPWDVHLSYELDGAAVSPEELAGKSGALSVHLTTSRAVGVDESFADSFMLQVTFTLNGDLASDIVADGATVASAGRNRTIAFTALPGQNADCTLTAQVVDFEMTGVQIAALPYSMVMEMPSADGLTEGIGQLSDAVSAISDGANQLSSGVSQLSSGAAELSNGSSEFGAGLAQLNANAGSLVEGSAAFDDALRQISDALGSFDMSGLEGLDAAQLAAALRLASDELEKTAGVLDEAHASYSAAYRELDGAMSSLRASVGDVSLADIAAVREAASAYDETQAADGVAAGASDSADRLINVYDDAALAVGAYGDGSTFAKMEGILAGFREGGAMYESVIGMAQTLDLVADLLEGDEELGNLVGQMVQLVDGLNQLADGYSQFHNGLVQFADGLNELSVNYAGLDGGMAELAAGVSNLDAGTSEFATGVSTLNSATVNLPETMRSEIAAMMANYEFPEFDPISFVDSRNDANMEAVQFVLTTEAIEVAEPEAPEEAEEEEMTIIDRFFALFK